MYPYITLLLLVCSTALSIFLWFRDVRRTMRERRNVVDSAYGQFMIYQKKAYQAIGDPETAAVTAAVYERSAKIYRQAVCIYNGFLCKPWILLPAYLMGFRYLQNV